MLDFPEIVSPLFVACNVFKVTRGRIFMMSLVCVCVCVCRKIAGAYDRSPSGRGINKDQNLHPKPKPLNPTPLNSVVPWPEEPPNPEGTCCGRAYPPYIP